MEEKKAHKRSDRSVKKVYQAPKLTIFGLAKDLTLGNDRDGSSDNHGDTCELGCTSGGSSPIP